MAYKIFLCEPIHPAALALLRERAEIVTDPAAAHGAINRNLRMDRAFLDRCPWLRVIGIHGTGTDGVDLAYARERGIRVVYTPGKNARSVAELVAALTLSMARGLPRLDRTLQGGKPLTLGGDFPGMELRGRVFGTLGCGAVGMEAARIMKHGFGMEVLGYSRHIPRNPDITPCESPRDLFSRADVVSISVPLTETTRGLVDRDLLERMKPGSILINTSRGAVVDEAALYAALREGPLAAAASDVLTHEPPTRDNPLVSLPNFLATPHIGANTDEALRRVSLRTVEQVLAVLAGDTEAITEPPY